MKIGLLVMAFGTLFKVEDIERYYGHIRIGRVSSAESLKNLTERYYANRGISLVNVVSEKIASEQ